MSGVGPVVPPPPKEHRLPASAATRGQAKIAAMEARLWVAAERRRRRRTLAVLTLVAGLAGGTVIGGLAGARRADSAMHRLLERSDASHAFAQLTAETGEGEGLNGSMDVDFGAGLTARDVIAELRRDPRVEALSVVSYLQAGPADVELGAEFITVAAIDGAMGRSVDRARVLDGRLPHPDRVDEIAVNELAASMLGLGPGDTVPFVSRSPGQLYELVIKGNPAAVEEEPDGPRTRMRVTGVIRLPADIGSADEDGPAALATPAFYRQHGPAIGQFGPNAQLRLRRGYADVPAMERRLEELTAGNEGVGIEDNRTEVQSVEDAARVQAVALLLFALVALVAGLVALGQAVSRQLATSRADMPTLHALGLTRRERALALLGVMGPPALVGAVVAAAVALLSSNFLPIGIARRAEPAPGFTVDLLVVGVGAALWLVISVLIVSAVAWRLSAAGTTRATTTTTPTAMARLASRLGSPTAVTGLRMAFDPRRGGHPVPVRSALVGAAAAAAGLLAVMTFGASLERLLDAPGLAGYPWDMEIAGGEDRSSIDEPLAKAVADPEVDGVLLARIVGDVPIAGQTVQGFGVEAAKGEAGFTVLSGRAPQAPDEVALGPVTMRAAGVKVGDTVRSRTADGRATTLTVVGTALFPIIDASTYAAGALFTLDGLDRLDTPTGFHDALVRFAAGVDVPAARDRWEGDIGYLFEVTRPAAISNLDEARGFPTAVAAFLALLGIAAVAHALVLSGRQWRADLAVLRTLGMLRRQLRTAAAVQATAIAVVGLVVGAPLGLAAGRAAWSLVAASLDVVNEAVVPLGVLAVAPAALVVVNILGLVPGRNATRAVPAAVLRTE